MRCAYVIRGISIPCEVDFISRIADALGVVVPMPALPVDGKTFVCAERLMLIMRNVMKQKMQTSVFIIFDLLCERTVWDTFRGGKRYEYSGAIKRRIRSQNAELYVMI